MSVELFLLILSAISVLTGLTVEAIKQFYKKDAYNLIAGIVAVVLTIAVAICYAIWFEIAITGKFLIFFICLAFSSWLSAMVGFDKVKQAILQIGAK